MSGTGNYTYADGSSASGTFQDNGFTDGTYCVENDFGSYSFTIENSIPIAVSMQLVDGTSYSGGLEDGKLTGTALIKYSNGDSYSGSVVDGVKTGSGLYTWVGGAKYDGHWSEDKMSGTGIYYYPTSANGYKLSGSFDAGKPNGTCQYYSSSSTSYKTDWVNGSCVKIYE